MGGNNCNSCNTNSLNSNKVSANKYLEFDINK